MKSSVALTLTLLAVALTACRPKPQPLTREQIANQIPGRNLATDPPVFTTVELAPSNSGAGNFLLTAQAGDAAQLPPRIAIAVENDQQITLQDDGRDGDATAGDRIFSAFVTLDKTRLAERQQALVRAFRGDGNRLTVPVFPNRSRDFVTVPVPDIGSKFRLLDPGIAAAVTPARSLIITGLGVIEDPSRTFNPCTGAGTPMGKWTFGYLMQQMANTPVSGIPAEQFVRRWLRRWEVNQTVNDFNVPSRIAIQNQIVNPWLAASGGGALDLSKAPFRLLAIVNRVDLRQNAVYGGGNAGEGRFVFGAINRSGGGCAVMQFTVIFEYGVPIAGCSNVKAWGQKWIDLAADAPGSAAFNAKLEAITETFAAANANPSKPNRSALNQVRTNEIALASPWELREFQIFSTDSDAGHLRQVTVKQTPDIGFNNTAALANYVNTNAAAVQANTHIIPLEFPSGTAFLGGSAPVASPVFAWNHPAITPRPARHSFALNTCNGCHGAETQTPFLMIRASAFGSTPTLAGFLTGIDKVPDAADGAPLRNFDDQARRGADLDNLVNSPCLFQLEHKPLHAVH